MQVRDADIAIKNTVGEEVATAIKEASKKLHISAVDNFVETAVPGIVKLKDILP